MSPQSDVAARRDVGHDERRPGLTINYARFVRHSFVAYVYVYMDVYVYVHVYAYEYVYVTVNVNVDANADVKV